MLMHLMGTKSNFLPPFHTLIQLAKVYGQKWFEMGKRSWKSSGMIITILIIRSVENVYTPPKIFLYLSISMVLYSLVVVIWFL